MAVPMLNYATMPVVQPPSEMQGFSNALLQAGALRQDRLKAEQARADQLQQTQFNQNIATQQLGLQQKADARAEQAQQWQGQRQEMDMATLQAQAIERDKRANFQKALQDPQTQATLKGFLDAKDERGYINAIEGLTQQYGLMDDKAAMEVSNHRMRIAESEDRAATNELQRALARSQMLTETVKRTALAAEKVASGQADPAELGKLQDDFQNQMAMLNGNLDKAEAANRNLGIAISAKPTLEGLKEAQSRLEATSPEFARMQDIINAVGGKPTQAAQEAFIRSELGQLGNLKDENAQKITYLRETAIPTLSSQLNAIQTSRMGGNTGFGYVSPIQPVQQAPTAPERSMWDAMQDAIFGSPDTGSGYIPGSVQRRETPPSTTFKAKGDAMNLPTSDSPRPSKASTTAAQTAPRYVDPAERNRRIQEISGKIQDIEKALPGLDVASEIYGPMNQRIRENSERELARLRIQLKEAEDLLPIQRTPVSSGRAFTGVY